MRGRTTLVVAHRLSTIRPCSSTTMRSACRIVEQGTHDLLLARGGRYARLHTSQAS
jgi:ATP-binding cassette subfamily B protein